MIESMNPVILLVLVSLALFFAGELIHWIAWKILKNFQMNDERRITFAIVETAIFTAVGTGTLMSLGWYIYQRGCVCS